MARQLEMATRDKQGTNNLDIVYLAGIIDADGCISIAKMKAGKQRTSNPRYVLTVNVVNTSVELMDWLVKKFGGHYKSRKLEDPLKHRQTYDWFFNNGKACHLLKLIESSLLVKKDRALVGIELIEDWVTPGGGQGSKTSKEEVARRECLYLKMKELNQFGPVQSQRLSVSAPVDSTG